MSQRLNLLIVKMPFHHRRLKYLIILVLKMLILVLLDSIQLLHFCHIVSLGPLHRMHQVSQFLTNNDLNILLDGLVYL